MQLKDYPDLSQIFNNEVYKKYFDAGGNVQTALSLVNSFLEEYPCYPEAIIFKARMFVVEDKIDDALEYLKIAERIDKWRVAYLFDIAEILYKKAVGYLEFAFKSLFNEALEGLKDFLTGIDVNIWKET